MLPLLGAMAIIRFRSSRIGSSVEHYQFGSWNAPLTLIE
jgi:hypothetical protein